MQPATSGVAGARGQMHIWYAQGPGMPDASGAVWNNVNVWGKAQAGSAAATCGCVAWHGVFVSPSPVTVCAGRCCSPSPREMRLAACCRTRRKARTVARDRLCQAWGAAIARPEMAPCSSPALQATHKCSVGSRSTPHCMQRWVRAEGSPTCARVLGHSAPQLRFPNAVVHTGVGAAAWRCAGYCSSKHNAQRATKAHA